MTKIRYTIRLYRQHDLDLITFMVSHKFDLLHAIYSSLTAFANGDIFTIEIPPKEEGELPQLKRIYTKGLVLDDEKDKQVVELLEKIKPGYRNNFIKNVFRQYLCYPMSEEFLKDEDDAEEFSEMFHVFRDGKRVAKAGKRGTKYRIDLNDTTNKSKTQKTNKPKKTKQTNLIKSSPPESQDDINTQEESDDDEIFKMFSGLQ